MSVSLSDEDECVIFPVACGDHAQCINTEGSYICTCNEGFKMSLTGTCKGTREDCRVVGHVHLWFII